MSKKDALRKALKKQFNLNSVEPEFKILVYFINSDK